MSVSACTALRSRRRLATTADNGRLCALMRTVTMESAFALQVERDPNFFALYELQEGPARPIAITLDGEIEGMGAYLGRDAILGGHKVRIGYLGDLRFAPLLRGRDTLRRHLRPSFEEACAAFGCEVMLTTIISTNRNAVRALVTRDLDDREKPVFRPVWPFKILSVNFLRPRKRRFTPFRVRRAEPDDLPTIAARLQADHRERPFGYLLDRTTLERRIDRWPGLEIENFFLAEDRRGRLRGVCAVWDPSPVKRYRVLAYDRSLQLQRKVFNAGARLFRGVPLPPEGQLLRHFYLTHQSIVNDEPQVMASLVDYIYNEYFGHGYHFFSACVHQGDPLAPAFSRYFSTVVPACLHVVSRPGSPFETMNFGPRRPGFEMALV